MRSSLKPVLRLIALAAAAAGSVWGAQQAADLIETRNRDAIAAELVEGGHSWAVVSIDGLQATISGTAPDESARFRALRAVSEKVNPDQLRDAITVAPAQDLPPPAFRLELLRTGDTLTAMGLLPGGVAGETRFLDAIADTAPGLASSEIVTVSADPEPAGWEAATRLALTGVAGLRDGRAVVTGRDITVTGLAHDRAQAEDLAATLAAALPEGWQLSTELSLPRPVLAPFVMRLRLDDGVARFDACAASDADGAARIRAAARAAGLPEDAADCTVAHGAPDDDWDRVATLAIAALQGLGAGAVTLSDITVTLAPDATVPRAAVDAAIAGLERDLPAGYRVTLPADRGGADAAAGGTATPTFSATRSPEGLVQVRGPLPDTMSDDLVGGFAAARFDPDRLTLALRRRSDLPEGWGLRVLAGLDAFSRLDRGRLSVTPAMILLTGATGDPALQADLAARLTAALGPSEAFQIDIEYAEELDPVAALPTPEECLGRVQAIQARNKITFGPGSTELDGAALGIVRRIAAALRDCEGVAMEIGGHTDSQGRAEMNAELSQARADAVLNALMAERVLVGSLTAVGYGEERPVADNDTEDGREANRRIDFSLRYPLQGPPAPASQDAPPAEQATTAGDGEDGPQ
ncbi:OmpA family protein [Meridianimarinicoccus sp. RP-17]|uniref:OmpA family protein n=1 Tax=Meridianimarinicoccus zhengii TaxID=2056810 RepID=UPI000DADAE23|nr:OmpA family protein [Phycocomes zhengii]